MRNINTKIFNLAIFQKLIFGIFTAIFVKSGGEKRDKIGHIGQNTQLQKKDQFKNFLILYLNSEINFSFSTFLEHWF